jgi:hypothetical protein
MRKARTEAVSGNEDNLMEEETMNIKQGEVYVCTEPKCKAEIVVRRGADSTCPGNFNVRCCCGKEMVREDKLQYAEPLRAAKRA